jgi:hypothetical protein
MLAAFEYCIQVSAQPVAPSLGRTASTGTLSAFSVFSWYGQVGPITMLPWVKSWIWAV